MARATRDSSLDHEIMSSDYHEQLILRPLPQNTLLSSFYFESQSESFNGQSQYKAYSMFPRSLGQVIDESHTHELHLRFSQGWWDAENWGACPDNGTTSGGTGVELWAVIEGQSQHEAELHWRKLVNTLSGLFCASLNFIDSSQTTYPQKGVSIGLTETNSPNLYLLRGALAGEPVCTENLTPFIKLLPCKGKAGISSLLDGHKIFDAQWQAMSVDVVPTCGDNTCRYHMLQAIHAVTDVPRALLRRKSGVPKPVPYEDLRCADSNRNYCFPLGDDKSVVWRLSDIFGRKINGQCPLAGNCVHVKADLGDTWTTNTSFASLPSTYDYETINTTDDTDTVAVYSTDPLVTLLPKTITDIILSSQDSSVVSTLSSPPVYVSRSFTGNGQQRGGLRTVFTNPSETKSVRFVYFETLPWYMKLYLHTIKLETRFSSVANLSESDMIKDIYYSPAVDRERPSQIEFEIELPARTSASLSYDFDKSLLFIEEYPPDANHGFNIVPGVVNVMDKEAPYTTRTSSLLLTLPTPDFSMPYNVIILTCTVMALGFGTMFNLLVKRVVTEAEAEDLARQQPYRKIIQKFKDRLQRRVNGPRRAPFPYVDENKK